MKYRFTRNKPTLVAIVAWALLLGNAVDSRCDNSPRVNSDDSRDALGRPIGILWSASPLRAAVENLARQQNVVIWLDRRVDPDRPISASFQDTPIREIVAEIARREELGASELGSVLYIGPADSVAKLRTLAELRRRDARALPRGKSRQFLREDFIEWEDLTTPRELLATLGEENELVVTDLDRVAHDLWPAMRLPPLSLTDRLSLLLIPFDMTFSIEDDGKRVRLISVPDDVFLTRRYPAGIRHEEVASRWRELCPEIRIRIEGDDMVVEGRIEDHELLQGSVRTSKRVGRQPRRPGGEQAVDRLRIDRLAFKDQRLEDIIRHLADQLNLELKLDADKLRRSGIDLNQRVSLEITDVTIDELFQELLEPAGLTFIRRGSTLDVLAADPR